MASQARPRQAARLPGPGGFLLCCDPMKPAISWSDEAEQLLREVPFFVRPAVRRRIESPLIDVAIQT